MLDLPPTLPTVAREHEADLRPQGNNSTTAARTAEVAPMQPPKKALWPKQNQEAPKHAGPTGTDSNEKEARLPSQPVSEVQLQARGTKAAMTTQTGQGRMQKKRKKVAHTQLPLP
ncbi:hypothetical protein NDU88_005543 [Pleurodeles waltl]|uniref:Uncharacterized protein n=1 Tax=Pleurodeles waltl TaxID=8319 RepID=A0AAV7PG88_PLEWA|nr:hypothetical protein NDU88_005543 [Pleurodeles waltl]